MTKQHYEWTRFFCRRGERFYNDRFGYLYDPNSPFGDKHNPRVVTLEDLQSLHCLVLLGEPGTGKSEAIKTHRTNLEATRSPNKETVLSFNLSAYSTDMRLQAKIFESEDVKQWRAGNTNLHLYLDGLDECLLQIKSVAALLAEEISALPVSRLFLRIACRTAEWPKSLEKAFRGIWGTEAVGIYEILPLRRTDVESAAIANDIAPGIFTQEIERAGAVPLATKPITLNFLVGLFKKEGGLPADQTRLYEQGLAILCDEHNDSRRGVREVGEYINVDKLRAAERIAFLTIFSNRSAVWVDAETGLVPPEDLMLADLVDNQIMANGITSALVRETLSTGLFSARSMNELGWAHQTYAEFLAARYLVNSQLPLLQILQLIEHPRDDSRRLIPQLTETAAWLSSMHEGVRNAIIKTNAEVLLRSGAVVSDEQTRKVLTSALLELFAQDQLLDFDENIRAEYQRLAHSGLVEQIAPYIQDKSKGIVVRRVAIDIAEACNVVDLQVALANVALDRTDILHIRAQAAYAVAQIADATTKTMLRPLALSEMDDDLDDELYGYSLMACWPDCLTAEELFRNLHKPKKPSLYGSYQSFLSNRLMTHLRVQDLAIALRWVAHQQSTRTYSTFDHIKEAIIEFGWEHIENQEVLGIFAETALARIDRYESIVDFGDEFATSDREQRVQALQTNWYAQEYRRRLLALQLVPRIATQNKDPVSLIFNHTPLLVETDFAWVLERLESANSVGQSAAWAKLVRQLARTHIPEHMMVVYEVAQRNPYLAAEFQGVFGTVTLGSEEAEKLKQQHEQMQRLYDHPQPKLLDPSPAMQIISLLEQFEAGNIDAWWHLINVMHWEPDGRSSARSFEPDIRRLPGWQEASEDTRSRIVAAANLYALTGKDNCEIWVGKPVAYNPALAGYRALFLLTHENHQSLVQLPQSAWEEWAEIIADYPTFTEAETMPRQQALVHLAYLSAPHRILSVLRRQIEEANEKSEAVFGLWKYEQCWDDQIASELLSYAKIPNIQPNCLRSLLGELLERSVSDARSFAEELLCCPSTTTETPEFERTVLAAELLITKTFDAGWTAIWPLIQTYPNLGRTLVSRLAHRSPLGSPEFVGKLSEDEIADFYIWIAQQFPHSEDPMDSGDGAESNQVTPRKSIGWFRDQLLEWLKARGTSAAVRSIARIKESFPEIEWLKWTLLRAQKIARQNTWTPLSPSTLLAFTQDSRKRLVQSEDQLIEVILESLRRFEQRLRAETPTAFRLWNERPSYRPKPEERLSDEIKNHLIEDLQNRGIVANREVDIRPTITDALRGQRIDIKVQAVEFDEHHNPVDVLTVIIEVKGNWNPELFTAMRDQLRDRYLRENVCQHGIYLVGWFNCTAWDAVDYRKRQVPKMSLENAIEEFERQAQTLSCDGVVLRSVVMNTALPEDINENPDAEHPVDAEQN